MICVKQRGTHCLHPYLSGSAGLYKQYIKDDYKIDITKIHTGWAGPWAETQNIKHVNIHIYKKILKVSINKSRIIIFQLKPKELRFAIIFMNPKKRKNGRIVNLD